MVYQILVSSLRTCKRLMMVERVGVGPEVLRCENHRVSQGPSQGSTTDSRRGSTTPAGPTVVTHTGATDPTRVRTLSVTTEVSTSMDHSFTLLPVRPTLLYFLRVVCFSLSPSRSTSQETPP